jgi:serine/threonine protein kinase
MMDVERYRRIDEIFQAALELDPRERPSYLSQACGGDESLLKEVEYLLASEGQPWELIGTPAFEMVAPLLARDQPELNSGDSVGRYNVVSLLGVGGMGHVYLAEDVSLGRKVALKLLPTSYTRDGSRLRRFQQEARAASALNHPNILTIHELGEVDGRQFIATEFVEGETLRERLKRGLNLPETLDIAIQIAGALAAAHKAGIVHRDIKPENIMLRRDGYVKVLDFGLAKLTEQHELIPQPQLVDEIDISSGLVMGTVKYMSPEQARGREVDPRSDIFSFGVVLYEMIAGRAPFAGKTTSDLITAILREKPGPLANAPDELQEIINKALRKKKEDRYQTIQDLLTDLTSLKENKAASSSGVPTTSVTSMGTALSTSEAGAVSTASTIESIVSGIKRHKTSTAFILAGLAIVGVSLTFGLNRLGRRLRASSGEIRVTRIPNTDKAVHVAVSPNGEHIAYTEMSNVGKPSINQTLSVLEVATDNRVQIVPPAPVDYGGLTYSRDGTEMFYVDRDALYRISARGGEATKVLSDVSGAISFAPDGAQFAFVRVLNADETAIVVANVNGNEERVLATRKKPEFISPGGPAWSPDGRLIACAIGVLAKNRQMNVTGFDVTTGEEKKIADQTWDELNGRMAWLPDGSGLIVSATTGAEDQVWQIPYPSGEARRVTSDPNYNYGDLCLTSDGKNLVTVQSASRSSIWIMPKGDSFSARPITSGEHNLYRHVAWTPDGRILYASNIGTDRDIWIMNGGGTEPKQLTANAGVNLQPQPSADGRYVVFTSNRANKGTFNIWRMNIDGSNPAQLTHGSGESQPVCSPDGHWVVYSKGGPNTTPWQKTLWKVSIDGGEPVQVSDKPSSGAGISPDGNVIACWYAHDPAEQNPPPMKIALIPFAGGPPIKILDAIRTAIHPVRWNPDGQSIDYIDTHPFLSNVWSQPINGGPSKQLTQFTSELIEGFDWSRDGTLVCSRLHGVQDVVLISDFR